MSDLRRRIARNLAEAAQVHASASRALPKSVEAAARRLHAALKSGRKLLLCGNGGSASTAQHVAAELVGRFEAERPGLAAIALTAETATLTALVNDYPPERIFARQLEALGQRGDVLFVYTGSGNSPNLLEAARAARKKGVGVVGFTGEGGGKLAALCDLLVAVPSKRMARIQEIHLSASHAICAAVDELLAQGARPGKAAPAADAWPKRLGLLVFDFDGVMTDNAVLIDQHAKEAVRCNRSDGWGVGLLRKAGVPMAVLSTEANPVVAARCRKLKLDCHQDVADKRLFLQRLMRERKLKPVDVIFVGNDHNDLGALQAVGFPVVVGDAHPSVLPPVAKWVLRHEGGRGAVREVCDEVLKRLKAGTLKLARRP